MSFLSMTQVWILIAVIFIIIELFSMSLYLLIIAASFLLAAFFAYIDAPLYLQIAAVFISSMAGLFLLAKFRSGKISKTSQTSQTSLKENISSNNLDIGARVWVDVWQHQQSQVIYKGAVWQARLYHSQIISTPISTSTSTSTLTPTGWYIIKNIEKNTLILELEHS